LIAETLFAADAMLCAKPAHADLMDGDLAEEQAKEKEELRDMKREMDDINSTVDGAMGQLNELGQKFNNQQNAKRVSPLRSRIGLGNDQRFHSSMLDLQRQNSWSGNQRNRG